MAGAAGDPGAASAGGARPPRRAAEAVLQLDTPRVRVTEWRFGPGASTGWHRHELDYVVVPLATGALRVESAGPGGAGRVEAVAELVAGRSYVRERGVEHEVVNAGDGPFAFVEVELKPALALGAYEAAWPPDDPDAGFRALVAEYARIDPLPTLERLSADKGIPVGALARFVLARYAASGSEALLEIGPRVVRQMADLCRQAEDAGTDQARLAAYRALAGIVSWLAVPLEDPGWRPGGG
jgi:quercetin dioxygenase-like cupin family protein